MDWCFYDQMIKTFFSKNFFSLSHEEEGGLKVLVVEFNKDKSKPQFFLRLD